LGKDDRFSLLNLKTKDFKVLKLDPVEDDDNDIKDFNGVNDVNDVNDEPKKSPQVKNIQNKLLVALLNNSP
jgi:hypothetical protein